MGVISKFVALKNYIPTGLPKETDFEIKSKEISINEAIENIFIRTRQYAKRQKKWFNVNNYDISFDLHEISKNDIVDKLIQIN